MADTGLTALAPLFEGRRPSRIDAPPSGGEIKKLRERLHKHRSEDGTALSAAACDFLATAVTAPATVRTQLSRPTVRPTATGHLEVIRVTVPIDCVAPDPTNGRVVGVTSWTAGDFGENQTMKLWAPADMAVHPDAPCEVLLLSDSLSTIKQLMEEAAENTKRLNPDMEGKITRDGILDPLLCQLVHIETLDGHRGVALITRDGSTRCSFAKAAHRSAVHDAFFGAARDVEWRRARWAEMKRLSEQDSGSITEAELVALRTFLVDVEIVVGFKTSEEKVSPLDAVDDVVRRTHVEVTHPWKPIAQRNSEADKLLSVLRNEGQMSPDQFLLYGGRFSRSQRSARDLPVESDEVVAQLMLDLGAAETRRGQLDELHAKIRAVDGRGAIRNRYKAELVGALGLRQFAVDVSLRDTAHLTLGEALSIATLWDLPWTNTTRSAGELRDAALDELDLGGEPGPSCRELLIKASAHLAARGWVKRESRDPRGGFRDQRPADAVLQIMHAEPQGVHALCEALTAGRRGEPSRAMTGDGEVIEQVAGDPQPMNNSWLRQTFTEAERDTSPSGPTEPLGAKSPREQVADYIRSMERGVVELRRSLDDAEQITDEDGRSFLSHRGWTTADTVPLAAQLNDLAAKLNRLGLIDQLSADLPPASSQLAMASADGDTQ